MIPCCAVFPGFDALKINCRLLKLSSPNCLAENVLLMACSLPLLNYSGQAPLPVILTPATPAPTQPLSVDEFPDEVKVRAVLTLNRCRIPNLRRGRLVSTGRTSSSSQLQALQKFLICSL